MENGNEPLAPAGEALTTTYTALLGEVKQRIQDAQLVALRVVNQQLIGLYWDIGRLIVERQLGIDRSVVRATPRRQ
jgi:hypothetical protein